MITSDRIPRIKFPFCCSAGLKVGFWVALSILVLGFTCLPAGAQTFRGNETSNGPFAGGVQTFFDTSALNASAANAVSGGRQEFYNSSSLNATAANAITNGVQFFFDTSTLNASAENAISRGRQEFRDNSVLNASAENAISGAGMQDFLDSSTLNATAANAITDGLQRFTGSSTLNASAANAISGGYQIFFQSSVLNALAANAINRVSIVFHNRSTLNASVANAVNGGWLGFEDSSVLNATAANALSGGVQDFYNITVLNASAENAVSGGKQTFSMQSVLNVLAHNALANTADIAFNNTYGYAPGGILKLNGYSTVIGAINSLRAGAGLIENGGASDGVLTVDTSMLGDSHFSGLLRDGGAGKFALVKTGAGLLRLSGISSYTGSTTVTGGTLQAFSSTAFSTASDFVVTNGMLDVNGYSQTIASLNNAGMVAINLKGAWIGSTLTVSGDYTGNGGTVMLNTVLNGDGSSTDRLVVHGDTSGQSRLLVRNVWGSGAQTVEGIRVIEVDGNSGGEFTLSGDYVIEGQQAVVGGAYAYTLHYCRVYAGDQ